MSALLCTADSDRSATPACPPFAEGGVPGRDDVLAGDLPQVVVALRTGRPARQGHDGAGTLARRGTGLCRARTAATCHQQNRRTGHPVVGRRTEPLPRLWVGEEPNEGGVGVVRGQHFLRARHRCCSSVLRPEAQHRVVRVVRGQHPQPSVRPGVPRTGQPSGDVDRVVGAEGPGRRPEPAVTGRTPSSRDRRSGRTEPDAVLSADNTATGQVEETGCQCPHGLTRGRRSFLTGRRCLLRTLRVSDLIIRLRP